MKGYAPGWQVRCRKCGLVREAGEAGHIRVGGWSWKSYVLGWCPQCRRPRLLAFEREGDQVRQASPK